MSQTTWLSISLFNNKSKRPVILRKGISLFLHKLHLSGDLICFRIFFNSSGGENIRVAILSATKSASRIACFTDNYFKSFYKEKGYIVSASKFPVNSLFLDFPNNSIQYGLFTLRRKEYSPSEVNFHNKFNSFVIAALGNPSWNKNKEALFFFAFCLNQCLLNHLISSVILDKQMLVHLIYEVKASPQDIETFRKMLQKDDDMLKVPSIDVNTDEFEKLVNAELNEIAIESIDSYIVKIKKIKTYINECIGLLPQQQQQLNYYINQTFKIRIEV